MKLLKLFLIATLLYFISSEETCSAGFFYDATEEKCVECSSGCKECKSTLDCQTCYEGFMLDSDNCLACSVNCLECDNVLTCLTCKAGYSLSEDNLCVMALPDDDDNETNETNETELEDQYSWLEELEANLESISMETTVVQLIEKFPFLEKVQQFVDEKLDLEENWTALSLQELKEKNWSMYGEQALQSELNLDEQWNLTNLNLTKLQEKVNCTFLNEIIAKLNASEGEEAIDLNETLNEIKNFNAEEYAKEKLIEHLAGKIQENSEGDIEEIKEAVKGMLAYDFSEFNLTHFENEFSGYDFDVKSYLLEQISKKTGFNAEQIEKMLKYNYSEFNLSNFEEQVNAKTSLDDIISEEFDANTAEIVEQAIAAYDTAMNAYEVGQDNDPLGILDIDVPDLKTILMQTLDEETATRIQEIYDEYQSQPEEVLTEIHLQSKIDELMNSMNISQILSESLNLGEMEEMEEMIKNLSEFNLSELNFTQMVDDYLNSMNITELLESEFNSSAPLELQELIENISDYNYSNFNYTTFLKRINFTELHWESYEQLSQLTMDDFVEELREGFNISQDSLLYDFLLEFEYMAEGEVSFEDTMALFQQYNFTEEWNDEKIEQLLREYNSTQWQFILDEYDFAKSLSEDDFKEYIKNKWHSLIKALIYQKGGIDIDNLGDLAYYESFTWEDALLHLAESYNFSGNEELMQEIEQFIEKVDFSEFSLMENLTVEAFKKQIEEKLEQYLEDEQFNLTEYIVSKLNVTLPEYEELKNEWEQFNWTKYFESKYENFSYENFNFSEYFNESEFGFTEQDLEKLLQNQTWFENFNFTAFQSQSQWNSFKEKATLDLDFNKIIEQAWMKTIMDQLDLSEETLLAFFTDLQAQINEAISQILQEIEPDFDDNETNETEPNETEPNETNETNETEECDPTEIEDCNKCEVSGICQICKHGLPFASDYQFNGQNLAGLCKCPLGSYKTMKGGIAECVSLEDVNPDEAFSDDTLGDQDLDGLAESSQIAYAMLDDEGMTQDEKEDIQKNILEHLTKKIKETAITSENLDTVIDVVNTVKVDESQEETQTEVIDTLISIADNVDCSSDADFTKVMNLVTEIDQNLTTTENQKNLEKNVMKKLTKSYLDNNKQDLTSGEKKSIKLTTGVMEISKIEEEEQEFTGAKLKYPSDVLTGLKGDDSESVMVTVKVIEKKYFNKPGVKAELQVDPISIDNFKETTEGMVETGYAGETGFSICFDDLASLTNPVCMYWDDENDKWSTEGVSLNTETSCCESKHFSTFGVIKGGEQEINIQNDNPGEYGEGLLCSSKTPGCLECDAITGDCLVCAGYYPPIQEEENKICQCKEGERIVYESATDSWSCSSQNDYTIDLDSISCDQITLDDFKKLKEYAYTINDTETLSNLIQNKLSYCQTYYKNDSEKLLLATETLNGIIQSQYLDNTLLNTIFQVATNIQTNQNSNLQIYQQLIEFYGQFTEKQVELKEGDTNETEQTMMQDLQSYLETCSKSILKQSTIEPTKPVIYHFSNIYIRGGELIAGQQFTSQLYQNSYGIQFSKDLLTDYVNQTIYYVHMIQKYTPYTNQVEEQSPAYSQYFRFYDGSFEEKDSNELIHCGDEAPIQFKYTGDKKTIALQTWSFEEKQWVDKVLCYDDVQSDSKICFPANYDGQLLFVINEIPEKDGLLFDKAECYPEDIPGCNICNSEKECEVCEVGKMLVGENYEFYGRCECPEGFYKSGFIEPTCRDETLMSQEWEEIEEKIVNNNVLLDQSFFDVITLVMKYDNENSYKIYLDKIASLMETEIDQTQYENIKKIVEDYSSKPHGNCEEAYLIIFGKFKNYLNDLELTLECNYQILKIDAEKNITLENMKLIIDESLLNETKEKNICDNYQIIARNLNSNNPYEVQENNLLHSSIVDFTWLCYKESALSVIETLELSSEYSLEFSSISEDIDNPKCVYWNENDKKWDSEGGITEKQDTTYQCKWNHFTSFAIMNMVCDSRCLTCSSYDTCTSCYSNDYFIDDMCYSKHELGVDQILREGEVIYIRDVNSRGEQNCLGMNDDESSELVKCNEPPLNYKQILWTVQVNDNGSYQFKNNYKDSLLKIGQTDIFTVEKITDLPEEEGNILELYKNEARLQNAEKKCLSSENITFTENDCDTYENTNIALWWEFITKLSSDHEPMDIQLTLDQQADTIAISLENINNENLDSMMLIIAGDYSDANYQGYLCSSGNAESSFDFGAISNEMELQVNLEIFQKCGFELTQLTDEKQYKLTGVFLQYYEDTLQLFYNEIEIAFSSEISISTDLVNEAQITQITIQKQGTITGLETSFIATVKLKDSVDTSDILEITNSIFTIEVSLPSTATSSYQIVVPEKATLQNVTNSDVQIDLALKTEQETINTWDIEVSFPEGITDGNYRMKFQCGLTLDETRILLAFPRYLSESSSNLIIDKSITVNKGDSSKEPDVFDNSEEVIDDDDTMSMNVGIILLIVLSGLVAVALILGIIYYAWKIQKNKQMREKMEAAKNQDSIKVDESNSKEKQQQPEIEIQQLQKEDNQI